MTEKIILINKFYREFCFSNPYVACYLLQESSFYVIEKMLNGELEYSDTYFVFMQNKLLLTDRNDETEIDTLNGILCRLTEEVKKLEEQINSDK